MTQNSKPTEVVQVENLVKVYGTLRAVDGISFDVHRGEVFGMLGPNGAGKTTTVEIIDGLRTADSGKVTVLGMGARRDGIRHMACRLRRPGRASSGGNSTRHLSVASQGGALRG